MNLGTFTKRAIYDLKHHFFVQLMTTLVVLLSVLIFSFFLFIYVNLASLVDYFGSELGMVVFLKTDVDYTKIPSVHQRLTEIKGVQEVRYYSPEDGFRALAVYLGDEKDVLDGISPDFLPSSFQISLNRSGVTLSSIEAIASELLKWEEVEKVQYARDWVDKLDTFTKLIKIVAVMSCVLLLSTASFVVANTIKLQVYARAKEIEIMRLVGATSGFIQMPFLLQAFAQGLLGASLAILATYPCYRYSQAVLHSSQWLKGISLMFLPMPYIAAIIAGSITICVLVTHLSLSRFIRV